MKRFIYTAISNSAKNDCSLSHTDQQQKRWFGTFIKDKVYIVAVHKNPDLLYISGFFNMTASYEVPKKNKKSKWVENKKEGLGYFNLQFKKEIATKFLKYSETQILRSKI